MPAKLITAPASEPVTLAEAKLHLRVDLASTVEDELIGALIVAARQGAEQMTGRALMLQTWELALDAFDAAVFLQRPPLVSITSVTYLDVAGASQTLAPTAYVLDSYSEPARLTPAANTCWPETLKQANAVTIRFQAGYADSDSVPQEIKSWMLLRIGALYANRESIVADARAAFVELPFDRLLSAYTVQGL